MFLPGKDPDPQLFGNPDKLLSSGVTAAEEQCGFIANRVFFLYPIPDSMQVSEMEKNYAAPGTDPTIRKWSE
jgi:hypothetical protein